MNDTLASMAFVGAIKVLDHAIESVLSIEDCNSSCPSCDASVILKEAREKVNRADFFNWETKYTLESIKTEELFARLRGPLRRNRT